MDAPRGGRARLAAPAPPRPAEGPAPAPAPAAAAAPVAFSWLGPGAPGILPLAFTPARQGAESRNPSLCAPGPSWPRATPRWAWEEDGAPRSEREGKSAHLGVHPESGQGDTVITLELLLIKAQELVSAFLFVSLFLS